MARESVEGLSALGKALEEGSGDFLLDLVRKALGHIMNAEVTSLCQAEAGERSPLRENSRNGYRERDWETRLGTVDLQIPKPWALSRTAIPLLAKIDPPGFCSSELTQPSAAHQN